MRLGPNNKPATTADLLPQPYPALRALKLRRGQTSLWVGAPGAGKSQICNNLAQRMGVPTLYWSADTDRHDVTVRTLAMWTGHPTDKVDDWLTDHESTRQLFEQTAGRADHVDWVFNPTITPPVIELQLEKFAETHGDYPHLMVLDNLSNALTGGGEQQEAREIREMQAAMQRLARANNTHIAVLHHATGQYETGDVPIPLGGVLQKCSKIPESVISIWRPNEGDLAVGIIKQRNGFMDAPAKHPFLLGADFGRGRVTGWAA
jgi:hypothetical protein